MSHDWINMSLFQELGQNKSKTLFNQGKELQVEHSLKALQGKVNGVSFSNS